MANLLQDKIRKGTNNFLTTDNQQVVVHTKYLFTTKQQAEARG